jgi:SsrA-binding protein
VSAKQVDGRTLVAQNRRARHDFEILDTYEAGIVLVGSEVKSFRDGKVQLRDSFAREQNGEVWLHGMHVAPYGYTSGFGMFDPDRARKLLLHKREIRELGRETQHGPLTLVPLSAYFKDGRAKVELALARGRREFDKRHAIADREAREEARREMGTHRERPERREHRERAARR